MPQNQIRIFFDVDGMLIDGWHSKPERRKRWDVNLKQDLGIDPAALYEKLFAPSADSSPPLMHLCVAGKRDLKQTLGDVLPGLSYHWSRRVLCLIWFEKDSHLNRDLLTVVKQLARNCRMAMYVATGQEHYRAAYLWNEFGIARVL